MQEFNSKSVVEEWNTFYRQGCLLDALKKHWRTYVPHIYNVDDSPIREERISKRERMAKKLLFRPMEIFLCDSNDPDAVLQNIKENDKPAQVCGHVFKSGEPTYSCRDCANDPTCVLCIRCFERSAHREHRYRMSMSGGGGYCDCGDDEAWKMNACCSQHCQTLDVQESLSPVERLPDDLVDRASTLFLSTLQYAVELLTWEHSDNLPPDLMPDGELTDNYITMLFNDEVHTYDQVIGALMKAIECSHSEATDFATVVDREGRSNVKRGPFQACEKVRASIEKSTSRQLSKPLKVMVMHECVVAFQELALQMIPWLRTIIAYSNGLRRLFCVMSMQTQDNGKSLLLRMLLADTQLWKVARVQCHQLFMSGVLMDQECKQQFAIMFTQNYRDLQQNFITDDHDHDVSVTNLSIQVYTVTSLARMLITDHDLLSVIMSSFLEHCQSKKNTQGKLSFQRTGSGRNHAIKRAWYMLYDYKYALLSKPSPEDWNDKLRANFMKGFTVLMDLLQAMQGMDAVTRQTGQHLEFEPEWESAFNLQLKLNDNFELVSQWCTSDKHVLIKSYQCCLQSLAASTEVKTMKVEAFSIACGCCVDAIKFDVASQPVSIHIPITRLLAGLHLHLGKFGLSFDHPELAQTAIGARELIELALRVRVLVGQANAGMWRRNGYSLINQIFFYHNVKCRVQMHDKDILMLQIGASLLPSDEFLLHVMNKFALALWANKSFVASSGQEDKLSRTVSMAEEFLTLLIHIISERYTVGIADVTEHDSVKREIIHVLCISPLAHSELAKALPEDENNETGMENVVNQVANFRVPTDKDKGKYELKEEFYDQYSVYFYHYSKADQSKSEEAQVKRRRQFNQTLALQPPLPPPFTPQFAPIINLLQCDVMVYIMEMLLMRTQAQTSRFWSEAQLERILHLIGLALLEQKRALNENNHDFNFITKATKADGESIVSYLEALVNSSVITRDSQKDLISWILQMVTDIQRYKNEPVTADSVEGIATVAPDTRQIDEQKRKAQRAEKRRAKIMAQMSAMQKTFIQTNAELFEGTDVDLGATGMETESSDERLLSGKLVTLGANKSRPVVTSTTKMTCILCTEEQEISAVGKSMVLASFIQPSTVLSHNTQPSPADSNTETQDLTCGLHTSTCGHAMHAECWRSFYETVMARETRRGIRSLINTIFKNEFKCPLCEFISNCVIPVIPALTTLAPQSEKRDHELPYNEWLHGLQQTVCLSHSPPSLEALLDRVQPHLADESSAQSADERLLTPLLPLQVTPELPPQLPPRLPPTLTVDADMDIESSVQDTNTTNDDGPSLSIVPPSLSALSQVNVSHNFMQLWNTTPHGILGDKIKDMVLKFAKDIHSVPHRSLLRLPALSLLPECPYCDGMDVDDRDRFLPMTAWKTCSFTIQSIERVMRFERQFLADISSRHDDCLSALVKFTSVMGVVVPLETMKSHCVNVLKVLIPTHTPESLVCLMNVDMFDYLTCLVMSLPCLHASTKDTTGNPSPLPTAGLNDQYLLQLTLTAHIVQIMLSPWSADEDEAMVTDTSDVTMDTEAEALLAVFSDLHIKAGYQDGVQLPPGPKLLHHIRLSCLPFLRCVALLFHYISGVPLPRLSTDQGEFEVMCDYLDLSTSISSLFLSQADITTNIIDKWCDNTTLKSRITSQSNNLKTYPRAIKTLVPLPVDYSDLINTASFFTCPRSNGDDSRAPTMCLVCRTMLCSQSYCCQTEVDGLTIGAVTYHAQTCGAGTGVFLRVRDCQVLLLTNKTKGCFYAPPYLDNYGETDEGLRRGNPLYLSQEAYRRLQFLWLNHGIAEEICHQLESNSPLLAIEWQHL